MGTIIAIANAIYTTSNSRVTQFSELTNRYASRVIANGGVVESLSCVDSADFMNNDWYYYFRVVDNGGTVESLECVII